MAGGRPTKYKPDFHPESFINYAKQGKSITQIAAYWDITRDTIYQWAEKHKEFSDAVKRGRDLCRGFWMDLGFSAMTGQTMIKGEKVNINLGFYVWLTKNMFGWSDKNDDLNNSSSEDSGQVKIELNVSKHVKPDHD